MGEGGWRGGITSVVPPPCSQVPRRGGQESVCHGGVNAPLECSLGGGVSDIG